MGWTAKQEKALKAASQVLQPGEEVLDVTSGMIRVTRMGTETSRNGSVLVTDRRIILYTKKLGGYEMNDFAYGLLSGLDYKKGMMYGNITLLAAGERNHVSQIDKSEVERVAKAIRDRMAVAQQHHHSSAGQPSHPAPSAADEIRKLAELHREGILSEDEFAAKKAQVLGL